MLIRKFQVLEVLFGSELPSLTILGFIDFVTGYSPCARTRPTCADSSPSVLSGEEFSPVTATPLARLHCSICDNSTVTSHEQLTFIAYRSK